MKQKIAQFIQDLVWKVRKENERLAKSPIQLCWDRAIQSSADFIEENMKSAMLFHDRRQFWKHSLEQATTEGLKMETGVFKGTSLRYLAKQQPKATFYGFDSFEGLNEDWHGHHKAKGAFNLKGILPDMPDNVQLIKGWLEDTYVKFLEDKDKKISFLHIDTDTYTPAKIVLKESKKYLQSGAIVMFDELHGYPNWKNGEYAALHEVFEKDEFEYVAFCKTQATIRIL